MSMSREDVVEAVCEAGVVAVVRLPNAAKLVPAVEALRAGGVHAIEVTLTVPGALDIIRQLVESAGDDHLLGVGSVVRAEQAEAAIDAGARYLVSPVCAADVIQVCKHRGVAAMSAGLTPTEILRAQDEGSDIVKVFPADLGGPAFIKAVRAPMPWLKLMPTGGVTPNNVGEWIRAGASAVGIGSALVDAKLVEAGDFAEITRRAETAIAGVRETRRAMNQTVPDSA